MTSERPPGRPRLPPWARGRWVAVAGAVVVIVATAVLWASSLLPRSYSMQDMGHADTGTGPAASTGPTMPMGHGTPGRADRGVDIATLTGNLPDRPPDVKITLVAREGLVTLADGRSVEGYSLNGQTPGPPIEVVQGDLVEVTLVNENVAKGTSLHWHGVDVPNAMDGVAGITQDAVRPGQSYTYRFVARQVGTYWYHSHQDSQRQVALGLLGPLVVRPAGVAPGSDVTALVHNYAGTRTINGVARGISSTAEPGTEVRVRIINTDEGPMPVWVPGASYRVLAVDGSDVNAPTPMRDTAVIVTAGGRIDLGLTVPESGTATVAMADATILLSGTPAAATRPAQPPSAPKQFVDLLSYGSPSGAAIDPATADRTFEYHIARRFGLLNGRPGLWWTINGHQYPDVPMFVVEQGELVVFRIVNTSGIVHPMHLHGHHAVVLSRNGVRATGSPWSVDSLNVLDGESYEIAFRADNPGIWADHCHTLTHAVQGLITHLAYDGYSSPYRIGGPSGNAPEGS